MWMHNMKQEYEQQSYILSFFTSVKMHYYVLDLAPSSTQSF